MAYLELSLEAYDDLIRAAGSRAGQIAKVCNEKGVWQTTPDEEAAAVSEPETETETEVADDVGEAPDAAELGSANKPNSDHDAPVTADD